MIKRKPIPFVCEKISMPEMNIQTNFIDLKPNIKPYLPMLAKPIVDFKKIDDLNVSDYILEEKYDGERLLVVCQYGKLNFYSRTLKKSVGLPMVSSPIDYILDGEKVYYDEHKQLIPFCDTGSRNALQIRYKIFDIQYLDGDWCVGDTLISRKTKLSRLYKDFIQKENPFVDLAKYVFCKSNYEIQNMFSEICKDGKEGLIMKCIHDSYSSDFRGWYKIKKLHLIDKKQEYDLYAYKAFRDKNGAIGGLECGQYNNGVFNKICKVSSGCSDAMRNQILMSIDSNDLFLNKTIVTIIADKITKNGSLRHPSIKCLRFDLEKVSSSTTSEEMTSLIDLSSEKRHVDASETPSRKRVKVNQTTPLTPSIDLQKFIQCLKHMLENCRVVVDEYTHHPSLETPDLNKYIDVVLNKQKFEDTQTSGYLDDNYKESTLLTLFNNWVGILEQKCVSFNFQPSLLRYFMATCKDFIRMDDFMHTNLVTGYKNQKKSANYSILFDYFKSPSDFASNLNKCDKNDIDGLKLVVENALFLPKQTIARFMDIKKISNYIYYNVHSVKELPYDINTYLKIPLSNYKLALLFISKDFIFLFDGANFVPVPANIEKNFTRKVLDEIGLNTSKEFIILEIMYASTLKIVDLYESNIFSAASYNERVRWLASLFHNIKIASTVDQLSNETNYLLKPTTGFHEKSYIYNRPPLTLAVVGFEGRHCKLAYLGDDHNLEYKINTNLTGWPSVKILTSNYKSAAQIFSEKGYLDTTIGNSTFRIDGLSDHTQDLFILETAIIVEIKEQHKLDNICKKQEVDAISHVSEYQAERITPQVNGVPSLLNMNPLDIIKYLATNYPKFTELKNELTSIDQNLKIDLNDCI